MGRAKYYILTPNIKRMEGKKDIDGLIDVLIYCNKDKIRDRASKALGNIGELAIEPLLRKLDFVDNLRKKKEIELYDYFCIEKSFINSFRMMNRTSKERLIDNLAEEDPFIRAQSSRIISDIELSVPVEVLLKALEDKDDSVRTNAAYIFTDMKEERAVRPLLDALNDKYPSVRENAAVALGKYKRKEHITFLVKLLKDDETGPRYGAASGLGSIGDKRALEPLINALNDKEFWVREEAAWALGEIGDKRAMKPLLRALEDEDPDVRENAAEALGKIGGNAALKPLINHLGDSNHDVRKKAAEALGRIDDRKARSSIEERIRFRKNMSVTRQELKSHLLIILFGALVFPFMAILPQEFVIKDISSLFSLGESLPYWVRFIAVYLFIFMVIIIIGIMGILLYKFQNRNHIEILLDKGFDFKIELFKILKSRIEKLYKIKDSVTGVMFYVKNTTNKVHVVGIWHSHFYHDNDYALYVENYKLLDESDKQTILKITKQTIVDYLIIPEEIE